MPRIGDEPHEPGTPMRDVSKGEEGAPSTRLFQQGEDHLHAALHATLACVPALARDVRLQRTHLEVFLDVDREVVFRQPNVSSGDGHLAPRLACFGSGLPPRSAAAVTGRNARRRVDRIDGGTGSAGLANEQESSHARAAYGGRGMRSLPHPGALPPSAPLGVGCWIASTPVVGRRRAGPRKAGVLRTGGAPPGFAGRFPGPGPGETSVGWYGFFKIPRTYVRVKRRERDKPGTGPPAPAWGPMSVSRPSLPDNPSCPPGEVNNPP